MINGTDIVRASRAYMGVRWQHQGRSEHALDCLGLLIVSLKDAGYTHGDLDYRNYGRDASPQLIETVEKHCTRSDAQPVGSLVLFKFPEDEWPRHIGIRTEIGVIHCNATIGKVVEHGLRSHWHRWFHSAWLIPGVNYL